MQHTLTPWEVHSPRKGDGGSGPHDWVIVGNVTEAEIGEDGDETEGATCVVVAHVKGNQTAGDIPEANARLIVRAVNAHRADDGEPIDPDWVLSIGGKGGNDEPDVDVYDIEAGAGLVIRIVFQFSRGEIKSCTLGLAWKYRGGGPNFTLAYTIQDDPSRWHVRRLCDALGVPRP